MFIFGCKVIASICLMSFLTTRAAVSKNAIMLNPLQRMLPKLFLSTELQPKEDKVVRKIQKIRGAGSNGLIPYIGDTSSENELRWTIDRMVFRTPTSQEQFWTKFNLWRQYPWKKIRGKTILKAKINGALQLDPSQVSFSFGGNVDFEVVDSLYDVSRLFQFAAVDPRVKAILIDIGPLNCGYGKLRELRRLMDYFQQSGKEIIGYCSAGSEKEYYIGLGCNELYVPPDGSFDLRGFSSAATFVRGVFDKLGIEPQVQRIGKYKSFGDTFNRTSISEAQREVISSLIMESSEYWADDVALTLLKKTKSEVISELWESVKINTPFDLKEAGYITGVRYLDQVEDMLRMKNKATAAETSWVQKVFSGGLFSSDATNTSALPPSDSQEDFSLLDDLVKYPRRNIPKAESDEASDANAFRLMSGAPQSDAPAPAIDVTDSKTTAQEKKRQSTENARKESQKLKQRAALARTLPSTTLAGLYLRKMRKGGRILKGLPIVEAVSGARIAVINAAGGIGPGKSGNSGVTGKSLGSDTVIAQLRRVRGDPNIKAVVIRIDSPGGSALASDLMWREIRVLSREKPVIASMVDVAASGGYYMAMACDQIVAEDLTITGSIGVVSSKFNAKELFDKIGIIFIV